MGKTTKNTTAAPAPVSDAPKPAGKAPAASKAPTGSSTTRRRKPNTSSYGSYIYRVLKSQNEEIGITKKSMNIMDNFCQDMFERICTEAGRLARYNKRQTISSKEIQNACQLCIPGELGKHSMSEGQKAVTKFTSTPK